MPFVQPADLWHESGRWDVYGPELARLTDRHGVEYCLGPTHEELITSLVRNELRSYKDLPVSLYQTQVKFRDEIRPRFGLMRGREFVMKDGYSFHATQESLQQTYDETSEAYARMCDRMGLKWRAVEADSGQIGGKVTTEYMALAEYGEAEIVYCECACDGRTGVSSRCSIPVENPVDPYLDRDTCLIFCHSALLLSSYRHYLPFLIVFRGDRLTILELRQLLLRPVGEIFLIDGTDEF